MRLQSIPRSFVTERVGSVEDGSEVQHPRGSKSRAVDRVGEIAEDVGETHTVVNNDGEHHRQLR